VLACVAMEPCFKGNWLLKALGDCSYSVYLIHMPVLYIGWLASERFNIDPYWVFAVCVPIIALLSWASYRGIETRLYRLMKRWEAARYTPMGR